VYLKSLTLSGFKSFGKTIVFEFQTSVTAIVGPNGSGKSNVAEALRWVLGEQSIKSLRGKRGEDLIFNGSERAPRLGRAEVRLVFDNSRKQFPFEFDDVIISRRVLRDGTNEYLLNGSAVRLKDIFELLSRVGLGSTQHHIISQGEVDRILWTSPIERQEMIEEALGLKEYHLKLRDAMRKLSETETNMKQVEAQRREIQPHLKFLRAQAEKMKAHEHFGKELNEKLLEYAGRERAVLDTLGGHQTKRRAPLEGEKANREKRIASIQAEIQHEEKQFSQIKKSDESAHLIEELEVQRRTLERELGKIEGMLAGETSSDEASIPVKTFVRTLRETVVFVDELMVKDSFESLKSGLKDIKLRLEELTRILDGKQKDSAPNNLLRDKETFGQELRIVGEKINELKTKKDENQTIREDIMADLREREHSIREEERELEGIISKLREIDFNEVGFRARETEWKTFIQDAKIDRENLPDVKPFYDDAERHTILRSIERLRIKLEEAGGIDVSVLQEYEETQTRDAFLGRELEDLIKAEKSLDQLMKELESKLEEQFTDGLKKINTEFLNLFKQIFGGGKALLSYIPPRTVEGEEEDKGGVEISIDIPKKRLRSLDMLSGGERALTSVALLFAMSSVNPPPFLVLDETDAALDEANSQRYGDLLAELAKKTQLVLITHNRHTMSRAGVLYGVTMGNDGISKVLSVKFEEAKELAGVDV
jgi:chromosome segregation protein